MVQSLVRVTSIFVLLYALLVGANFWNILNPTGRMVSLVALLVVVSVWLLARWRAGWRWHRTPLDSAMPLWALAFGASLLMNPDSARRIVLTLWYVGLYAGLWYVLHDLLANRGLKRQTFVDVILFSGLIVVLFGFIEVYLTYQRVDSGVLDYRPRSLAGTNANNLGTFLVVVILIGIAQAMRVRSRLVRGVLAVYTLLAGVLLFLTDSRSAWVGLGVALLVGLVLLLMNRNLLSIAALRQRWNAQSRPVRFVIAGALVTFIVIGSAAALNVGLSLSGEGRGLSGRPELFQAALNMWAENPLAGRGPNTFGQHLPRWISLPPHNVHNHAHSLPINLAGELGLLGIIAAVGTGGLLIRALRRGGPHDPVYRLAGASMLAGLGVIHLVDITTLMPTVALLVLLAVVVVTAPQPPEPVLSPRGTGLRSAALIVLWAALFAGGFWDTWTYARYTHALSAGIEGRAYAETAEALVTVAAADPALVVYPAQQGYLWSLAAQDGETGALQSAINAYERAAALEPYYAPYAANLAALYWQAGEQQRGLELIQHAAALAPESWLFHYNTGLYAEALGLEEPARAAYAQALVADPDADLHPAWGQTPLPRTPSPPAEIRSTPENRSALAQAALLMEAGQFAEAAARLDRRDAFPDTPNNLVLRELLALAQNNPEDAARWFDEAQNVLQGWDSHLWLLLGEARLAQALGDQPAAQDALSTARGALAYDPLIPDYHNSTNFMLDQFFRQVLPRQFVPQLFYTENSVVLLYLLDNTGP